MLFTRFSLDAKLDLYQLPRSMVCVRQNKPHKACYALLDGQATKRNQTQMVEMKSNQLNGSKWAESKEIETKLEESKMEFQAQAKLVYAHLIQFGSWLHIRD